QRPAHALPPGIQRAAFLIRVERPFLPDRVLVRQEVQRHRDAQVPRSLFPALHLGGAKLDEALSKTRSQLWTSLSSMVKGSGVPLTEASSPIVPSCNFVSFVVKAFLVGGVGDADHPNLSLPPRHARPTAPESALAQRLLFRPPLRASSGRRHRRPRT